MNDDYMRGIAPNGIGWEFRKFADGEMLIIWPKVNPNQKAKASTKTEAKKVVNYLKHRYAIQD